MSLTPFTTYKLRISCNTYNHACYIEDTMNGFCMQKTNFPFLAIIFDDASTDGEAGIIRKYLNDNFDMSHAKQEENEDAVIIAAVHKENLNCHFLVVLLKYNFFSIKKAKSPFAKGWYEEVPYIAMCEGDDFWIDPQKLQKQVDFLDYNDGVSMVFSRCHVLCGEKYIDDEYPNFKGINDCFFSSEQLYTKWIVPTATIVYRSKFHRRYTDNRIYTGDIVINLSLAEQGMVYGMSDYTAVYRINENGLTISRKHNSLKMWEKYVDHIHFLSENFTSVPKKCYDSALTNVYTNIFCIKYDEGNCDYKVLYHIFKLHPIKAIELVLGKLFTATFRLNKNGLIRSFYRKIRYLFLYI